MAEARTATVEEGHTRSEKEVNKEESVETSSTRPNAWAGKNKARDFNTQSIRERTFQMRLPTIFKAKDVIISINGIIQREDIETVSQQRTEGNWTIVTRTAEAANKLILANSVTIGPEKEQYKIHARLPRSTLLTLPYVDPETSKVEIFEYFSYYGKVTRVTDEYYKDEGFQHVKTGRRLVFLHLEDGMTPPPYCIIKNQKVIVSYRGKNKVCFHCNVEGHSRAQCPIQRYKTCYNCGSPCHSFNECHEDTLITYHFDKNGNYPPYCYPKGYKGKEEIEYGEVNCKEDAFDYHVTFDPQFYTERARMRYEAQTYAYRDEDEQTKRQQVEELLTSAIMDVLMKTMETRKNASKSESGQTNRVDDNTDMNEEGDGDRTDWGPPAEEGDRTDWGPPAGKERLFTNEDTTDVPPPPPEKLHRVKATPTKNVTAATVKVKSQHTEPTDVNSNVQVVKRKLTASSQPPHSLLTACSSKEVQRYSK